MAVDKLVDSAQLDADLTTVADAIRAKGGTSAQLSFPDGMAQAIEDIETGGGIDALLYTNACPRFANQYPSENPVIYCPLVANWESVFAGNYWLSWDYKSITLKSDKACTGLAKAFFFDRWRGANPIEAITLDFPSFDIINYAQAIADADNLKYVLGTPLDFSGVTISQNSRWIVYSNADYNPNYEVDVRYKPNTLHVNHAIGGDFGGNNIRGKFTDAAMVSIANGLQAGAHTITLHADMKTKCQTIMGTVSQVTEDGVTYDFFTADASGTVTLENFITQTKGWTIA